MVSEAKKEDANGQTDLFEIIREAASFITDETLITSRYEQAVSYKFPTLHGSMGGEVFVKRMDNLVTHLGGPPESFLVKDGAVVPLQDHYPEAALNEAISVFNRARKGVVLADLYAFGTTLIAGEESPIKWKSDIVKSLMIPATQGSFWEHAETAYIRIASFWDRLGQILDFSYFNIRQFDRNGFSAVIDRIYSNVIPMNKRLADNRGWKAVRKFQTNETEDGLKWLLQRRNLLVHSLHLHPLDDDGGEVFESQFNHLEKAHKEKLRPRTPIEEAKLLRTQLELAASHFHNVLSVAMCSPSRKVDTFPTSDSRVVGVVAIVSPPSVMGTGSVRPAPAPERSYPIKR